MNQRATSSFAQLESCKENIRPSRQGRNLNPILSTACSSQGSNASASSNGSETSGGQSRKELFQAERYQLEGQLKIASEPGDILTAYCELIQHYEQYDLSKTLHLRDLLKQVICNKKLERTPEIRTDHRYVACYIRIMRDFCKFDRTVSLLNFMKTKRIGQQDVDFYLFAASFYTDVGDFAKAEKFYNDGLYKQLDGNQKLLNAFQRFQKLRENGTGRQHAEVDVAPSNQVGLKLCKGSSEPVSTKRSALAPKQRSNACKNDIYIDEPGSSSTYPENKARAWHGDVPISEKENLQQAGCWTEGTGLRATTYAVKNPDPVKFDVFQDEEFSDGPETGKRKVNTKMEKVLNKHKDPKIDPANENLIFAYPKSRCQTGTQIFQIEELRMLRPAQLAKIEKWKYLKLLEDQQAASERQANAMAEKMRLEMEAWKQEQERKEAEMREMMQAMMLEKMTEMQLELSKRNTEIDSLNSKLGSLEDQLRDAESPVMRQQIQRDIEATMLNIEELDPSQEHLIPWKVKKPPPPAEAVSGVFDESVETKMNDGEEDDCQDAVGSNDCSLGFNLEDEIDDVMGAAETPIRQQAPIERASSGNKFQIFCDDSLMADAPLTQPGPSQGQNFSIFCDDSINAPEFTKPIENNDQFEIYCDDIESQPKELEVLAPAAEDNFAIFEDATGQPLDATYNPLDKTPFGEETRVISHLPVNENDKAPKTSKDLFGVKEKRLPTEPQKRVPLGGILKTPRRRALLPNDTMQDGNVTGIEPLNSTGHMAPYPGESTSFDLHSVKKAKRKTLGISPVVSRKSIFGCAVSQESEALEETQPVADDPEIIRNPWDLKTIAGWTARIAKPLENYREYHRIAENVSLQKFRKNGVMRLGNREYRVLAKHGEGNFARVFQLKCCEKDRESEMIACKVQEPAFPWEFYMAKIAAERLASDGCSIGSPRGAAKTTMVVDEAFVFDNASVLVSPFMPRGTLLDLVNRIHNKQNSHFDTKQKLTVAAFYTYHVVGIVERLHKSRIIHADVKPDNFLMNIDNSMTYIPADLNQQLPFAPIILTDFGRSIDGDLINNAQCQFSQRSKTDDFECTEMKTGEPWCYEIDLYAMAGTIHVLLFNTYMKRTVTRGGIIHPGTSFPRYVPREWSTIFTTLLNSKMSCIHDPDLDVFDKVRALLVSMRLTDNVKFSDLI